MWGFVGSGGAARTGAGLFLLAGILALAGVAVPHSRPRDLFVVAVADLLLAAAARWLPWSRWHPRATTGLAVGGLLVLAFATWAFGGAATGTGPFFVLLFAWIGLHHPPRVAVGLAPLTAAAYIIPLIVTHQPPEVVGSAVVFVPVTTVVAVVIAQRVQQLDRARAQVEVAERWRAALTITLAHDVRAPLTSVGLALGMLADDDGLTAAERTRLTEGALRQVDRITRLAGGLLDAGRVEDGVLRLDVRPVVLAGAVHAAVAMVPADASWVRVDVEADLVIPADPERLEQILVNLIGNAVRHGAAPVVVTAEPGTADSGPDTIRVVVRDHGPGVPDSARPNLFGRFTAKDTAVQSAGLGLWIVRELARAHGGDAHHEPADPGARFVITLPL